MWEDLDYGREGLVGVSMNMVVLMVVEAGVLHTPTKDLMWPTNVNFYVILDTPNFNFMHT